MVTALMLSLVSCGSGGKWDRLGYFIDDDPNSLFISAPEEDDDELSVAFCMGDDVYRGSLPVKGGKLTGELEFFRTDDVAETISVTITKNGKDGVKVKVKGGDTYKLSHVEEAPIGITINVDGFGFFRALTDSDELESDGYTTSMVLSLMAPVTYELTARSENDWVFVKWTKDGADFSKDRKITVEFAETADFVAVFEYPRIHADDVAQYGDSHSAQFYEYPSDFVYDFVDGNVSAGTYAKGGFTTFVDSDLEDYFSDWHVNSTFDLHLTYESSMDHAVVYSAGERGGSRWGINVLALKFNSPEAAADYYNTIRDEMERKFSSYEYPTSTVLSQGDDEGVIYINGRAVNGSAVTEEAIYLEGNSVLLAVSEEVGMTKGTEAMTDFTGFFNIPDPKG